MKRSTKKGFTIVELVIVIAIIAILAAVLIPTFASLIQKANESNDIQAAKNMNTFLAAANVTGDVKSILDVYDVFEDSGFAVENYTPLYKNRYYYYDKEYNQILYVDEKFNVIYPTEHKGETSTGRTWMSLSMSTPKADKVDFTASTEGGSTINTVTVDTAAKFAGAVEAFKAQTPGTYEIKVKGTIDMMGGNCVIDEVAANKTLKITGEGNDAVIKNIANNKSLLRTTSPGNHHEANYISSALIGEVTDYGAVEISNITFENLNVKALDGGNIGLLVGNVNRKNTAQVSITGVTIKNSSLIGHRNAGALIGQVESGGNANDTPTVKISDITLDNVSVKTVGGRSALVVGLIESGFNQAKGKTTIANITVNDNCTFGVYNNAASKQEFGDATNDSSYTYINADKSIKSVKDFITNEVKTYCHKDGALFIIKTAEKEYTFYTDVESAQNALKQQSGN